MTDPCRYDIPRGTLGRFIDKIKLKKIVEGGIEMDFRVKALLEETGSIPVDIKTIHIDKFYDKKIKIELFWL